MHKIFASSMMWIIKSEISIPEPPAPGSLVASRVETVLLMTKDKGRGEEEGVLGGNDREGTPECGSERRNFKHRD